MIRWAFAFAYSLVVLLIATPSAKAQMFDLVLGKRPLGWVRFTDTGKSNALELFSQFDNTPLGVIDGSFEAVQKPVRAADGTISTLYQATSLSPNSSRVLTVLFDNGRPTDQWIEPPYRKAVGANLSEIPAGTGDLLDAFALVYRAQDCPETFYMYEGLRLVRLKPGNRIERDGMILCDMTYTVLLGPGHLSPFRFRSFDLTFVYSASQNIEPALIKIDLRVGVFRASLIAQ